jgi:hypothetical protein
MSDLEHRAHGRKVDVKSKVTEEHKQRNARRFMWHEQLIKSAGNLPKTSVLLADLIMHKRRLVTDGFVTLSAKDMADELGITQRGAQKARDRLVAGGWIEHVPFRLKKARYRIAFPPSRLH